MGKFSQETIIRTYRISQNYPQSPWGEMISGKKMCFFFVKTVIIEGGANLKSILTLQFLHSIIFWNFGGVQANILI